MPNSSPTSKGGLHSHHTKRACRAAIAPLLVSFTCLGLTACGASDPQAATAPSAQELQAYQQQRAQVLELVSCAHRHGVPLPAPDARNNVSTRGVNLKIHHRKAKLNSCFHKVVNKATREARARQARGIEEPSGGQGGGEASPASQGEGEGSSGGRGGGEGAFGGQRE